MDNFEGLRAVCDRLQHGSGHGSYDAAAELGRRLALIDAHGASADERLLHVALLHTRTAAPGQAQLPWATYAHRTALLLHGAAHSRTLDAADRLADVLRDHHCIAAATDLRRTLTAHYEHHGPADQHAYARLALAQLLHANGDCDRALQQADIVLYTWAPHHRPSAVHGPMLLLHVLRLIEACGLIEVGRETLHTYRSLLEVDQANAAAHLALQLLGDVPAIKQHRALCGADHGLLPGRHRRPQPSTRLRHAVLKQLTGDPRYGETAPGSKPAPSPVPISETWASPGLRAAVLDRYTVSRQTVDTIAARLGYPPAAVIAVLAAAGIPAASGQPNRWLRNPADELEGLAP